MILLYRVLTTLFYPLFVILIYFRRFYKKEDLSRYKEKIFSSHFNVDKKNDKRLIWLHAASIGELKSIIPIINQLNKKYKKLEFLITTTTLSSGNLSKIELRKIKNARHRFFPLDVGFLIEKFLRLWKPDLIFLVDSEIWPNLVLNAKKNGVPLALLNGRITSKTAKRWMIFPKSARKIFTCFKFCLTSNLETKKFLSKFNIKSVFFNGNIKLINMIDLNYIKGRNDNFLIKKRFWVAASTHSGEEIFCLKTHSLLKKKYRDMITIIAPRHIDRVQRIKLMSNNMNFNVQILKKNEKILKGKEIIIINSFGILQEYFKCAKSVFIGKSLIKKLENDGGQNPIDAAKLGCKIYHGPYVYNFKEIYNILNKKKISKKVKDIKDLSSNLIKDLKNVKKKQNQINKEFNNLGKKTLITTMKDINNFISNEI
jgi:3-deoxy-D-manno-octulosonic-acid transferase